MKRRKGRGEGHKKSTLKANALQFGLNSNSD